MADEPGWRVVIRNATLTLYTDGPPSCPDEAAAWRQVLDKLRTAAKEAGVYFDIDIDRDPPEIARDV